MITHSVAKRVYVALHVTLSQIPCVLGWCNELKIIHIGIQPGCNCRRPLGADILTIAILIDPKGIGPKGPPTTLVFM